jgi:hypothetical protein
MLKIMWAIDADHPGKDKTCRTFVVNLSRNPQIHPRKAHKYHQPAP